MTDDEALMNFVDYLSSVRNYSENTVISYKTDILEFSDFIKKKEDGFFFNKNYESPSCEKLFNLYEFFKVFSYNH